MQSALVIVTTSTTIILFYYFQNIFTLLNILIK